MKAIAPGIGATTVPIAENQDEYEKLLAEVHEHPHYASPVIVTRWTLEPAEREALARDAYAVLRELASFNTPEGIVIRAAEERLPELIARATAALQSTAAGEDIILGVLTFGHPLQPLMMQVGTDGYSASGVIRVE